MKSIVKKIIVIITVASAVNPAFVSAGWRDWFTASTTSALATLQENKKVAVASLAALVVAGCSARALYGVRKDPVVLAPVEKDEKNNDKPEVGNAAARVDGSDDDATDPDMPDLEIIEEVDPEDADLPPLVDASEEFLRMREFQERNAELELENLELQIKAGQDKKVFNIVADQLENEKKTREALRKELSQLLVHLEQREQDFTAEKSRLADEHTLQLRKMADDYESKRYDYERLMEQESGYQKLEDLRAALSHANEKIERHEKTIKRLAVYKAKYESEQNYEHHVNQGLMGVSNNDLRDWADDSDSSDSDA